MQVSLMTKIAELYGSSTDREPLDTDWPSVIHTQACPFLSKKCLKMRKSLADLTIGSCTVTSSRPPQPIMICPYRLLERQQIFHDCTLLLTLHEPGNELHLIPGLNIPGGIVDYCLTSVRNPGVVDFVGIEMQTLDTTGTVWPERQRFLYQHGLPVSEADRTSSKRLGFNWKMTAKTILVQLHHKISTFESLSKHLVLVTQDYLMGYMRRKFNFNHLHQARLGDSMHFHTYSLLATEIGLRLEFSERWSTDANVIALCLDKAT